MNWNPFLWVSKKYIEDIVLEKILPISNLMDKIDKENIGLKIKVENNKEQIGKIDDRLRISEREIAKLNTAMEVFLMLNNQNNNQILLNNE